MLCPDVNRCCYMFGEKVEQPLRDVTPTYLTPRNLNRLRVIPYSFFVNFVSYLFGVSSPLPNAISQSLPFQFPLHIP